MCHHSNTQSELPSVLNLFPPPPLHVHSAFGGREEGLCGRFVMCGHGGKGHWLFIQQWEQKHSLGASWEFHHQHRRERGQREKAREKGSSGKASKRVKKKKLLDQMGPGDINSIPSRAANQPREKRRSMGADSWGPVRNATRGLAGFQDLTQKG